MLQGYVWLLPVLWVVRFLKGVADTSMASGENAVTVSTNFWGIQVDIHQFIHVLQDNHVTVELHNTVIFHE